MTVVFCMPGRQYSGRFLECWSDLLVSCILRGVTPVMRREYTSNVYLARNLILSPEILSKGLRVGDAKALNGVPYDFLMWIDSDAVFGVEDFWTLLKHDVEIVAGSAVTNPTEQRLSWGWYREDGGCEFITKDKVEACKRNEKGLISVDFTGFHWVLVKRGVFEKMEYPWFKPAIKRVGENVFFPGEDISWSAHVKELGMEILIDPKVKVGHEKPLTLVA